MYKGYCKSVICFFALLNSLNEVLQNTFTNKSEIDKKNTINRIIKPEAFVFKITGQMVIYQLFKIIVEKNFLKYLKNIFFLK